jgi:hypothetical protein
VALYLFMQPISLGSKICECIILGGHRAKSISNSNDPPNSFHTSDLFIPHASISNAWNFVGRADDRVTLLNGEKVLPLSIEGRIVSGSHGERSYRLWVDREVPGLLLFKARTEEASKLGDIDYVDKVWPSIEKANEKSSGFEQIGREIVVMGVEVDFPETDKSTIKRAQVQLELPKRILETFRLRCRGISRIRICH